MSKTSKCLPLPPLLILSLGNPPPYANTLHSAGHTALSSLQQHLKQRWKEHVAKLVTARLSAPPGAGAGAGASSFASGAMGNSNGSNKNEAEARTRKKVKKDAKWVEQHKKMTHLFSKEARMGSRVKTMRSVPEGAWDAEVALHHRPDSSASGVASGAAEAGSGAGTGTGTGTGIEIERKNPTEGHWMSDATPDATPSPKPHQEPTLGTLTPTGGIKFPGMDVHGEHQYNIDTLMSSISQAARPSSPSSSPSPSSSLSSSSSPIHTPLGPGNLTPQPNFQIHTTRFTPSHPLSLSSRFLLHKSPTLMNASGQFAHRLYLETVRQLNSTFQSPSLRHLILPCPLVLLHDDLELPLGAVRKTAWSSSHRGHNGVKSAQRKMGKMKQHMWYRVAVGIGRPAGRDSDTVSEWVLRQTTLKEVNALKSVGPKLLNVLEEIEREVAMRIAGGGGGDLEGVD
ncbi:putative peptidyl-tRNA hydrolase [Zalerion maritima]|uniref:Peptidyl-tRNA hydrolase n=1 Tax=Zalerion maritima TaxID=339359 RepID=A0AAD5WVP7_9PEZI|nr:putative peptidyl-tRNA hydrolase [Zalerion maritima]